MRKKIHIKYNTVPIAYDIVPANFSFVLSLRRVITAQDGTNL